MRCATANPVTWLRPATEPGEDRNVGTSATRDVPAKLRPATEPGEDRNDREIPTDDLTGALRPATEPGEDRNDRLRIAFAGQNTDRCARPPSRARIATSPRLRGNASVSTSGLRPATEPGEDRNLSSVAG